MSWGQFFSDASKFRMPQTIVEGAAKGFIYVTSLIVLYDLLYFPNVDSKIAAHSSKILLGYLTGIVTGALMGATQECLNRNPARVPNNR